MKIGITGASGHVGANLCRTLLKHTFELRASVHENISGIKDLPLEKIKLDITNNEQVENFIAGCDVVIHLAAKISIDGDPKGKVSDINLQGTRNVVSACKKYGVKKLIHFSSIHAHNVFPLHETLDENRSYVSTNATHYDLSKVQAEKEVLQASDSGMQVIVFNPTSIFGPCDYYPSLLGSAMLKMAQNKIPAITPGGYDFVFVEDIVRAVETAITKSTHSKKYILSGTYVTIQNLVKAIANICNIKLHYPVIPFSILHIALPLFEMQSKLTGNKTLFTKESLKALKESPTQVCSTLAQKELNYTVTPFDAAIHATMDWYKQAGMLRVAE